MNAPVHPIHQIQADAAAEFGVSIERIIGPRRHADLVRARMIAMYRARRTGASLKTIGCFFGGRDHTTVIHAVRCVEANPEMLAVAIGRSRPVRGTRVDPLLNALMQAR